MKRAVTIALAVALAGCATHKEYVAVGGSKADGRATMAYDYTVFEVPEVDEAAGRAEALRRCQNWGYQAVEGFAPQTVKMVDPSGSEYWRVTREYQCLDG